MANRLSSTSLIRAILSATFYCDDAAGFSEDNARVIRGASPRAWRRAIHELELHKMLSLVGAAIERQGWASTVPPERLARVTHARDQAVARTQNNMRAFAQFLAVAREQDLQPLILKSTAMVALVGERMLAHPMRDIDLYVQPQQMPAVQRIVEQMGMVQRAPGADALNYVRRDRGWEFDVHHHFRLFGSSDLQELTVTVPAALDGLGPIHVFEPNVMLVHLLCHLNEHRRTSGYQLRWLHDLAIVLQHYRSEVDAEHIDELLPDRRSLGWLLRLVGFMQQSLNLPMPPTLQEAARAVPPLTLGEILRSLRPATWPLSEWRGWVRMAGHRMMWESGERRVYPRLVDLAGWPIDVLRERRALARAPQTLRP